MNKQALERFDTHFPLSFFAGENYTGEVNEHTFAIWQKEQTKNAMYRKDRLYRFLSQELDLARKEEREKYEDLIDWANGIISSIAFDKESGKIWQHWLDEGEKIINLINKQDE